MRHRRMVLNRGTPPPSRTDPTRTGEIRRRFMADMRRRIGRVLSAVWTEIGMNDAFGLRSPINTLNAEDWRFASSEKKVDEFRKWLAQMFNQELTGPDDERLWTRYVIDGFRKGAARAFDDYMKGEWKKPAGAKGERLQDFLTTAFRQPVAVEKVKLLAARVMSDLRGITDATGVQMTRVLTDGLVQGKSPRAVATELTEVVRGVTEARALTLARTETIRAHAEGQLLALKQLGVQELGVDVEWDAAGNACPLCKTLDGMVVPIDKAPGMLPRHPNCRCAWKPHVPKRVVRNASFPTVDWFGQLYADIIINRKGGANCGISKGGFQKGNKCAAGGGGSSTAASPKSSKKPKGPPLASPKERKAAAAIAQAKIASAPVPPKEKVQAYRAKLEAARKEGVKARKEGRTFSQREYLDARGSSKDRKRRAQQLFAEFGGEKKGYVVCHATGLKMHWTDDKKLNPRGFPKFEQGKIFTAVQGGGYQPHNLLPESFAANRSRNDEPVRKENLK